MCPKVTSSYIDQKVQTLLLAAKSVFIRKGFMQTTMKDIVEAANISRGGLYLYFSSTEEIFEALLELDTALDGESILTLMENQKSALEMIDIFFMGEKETIRNIRNTLIPATYEFFMDQIRKEKNTTFLSQRYASAAELLSQVIQYGVDHAEFEEHIDPEKAASFIIVFMEGLIVKAMSIGLEEEELNSQLEQVKKSVLPQTKSR